MKEVSKKEFKKFYFKYGSEADGWGREYWNDFFENPKRINMKCKVELPASQQETRMMIVNDYSNNEYRMFFFSIDQEEAFFDHPGK